MELLRGDGDVRVVGHRGAAALAPGNSLAAIEAAAAHGAGAVELDVVFGPGGGLLLAHDPAVLDGAPSLDDGLALAARLGLAVQLDLKAPGVEAGAAAALRRHTLLERSFVSSPLLPVLAELRSLEPALARALTYPDDRYGVSHRRALRPIVRPGLALMRALLPRRIAAWLQEADAHAATLNAAVVTRAAVAACHAFGAAVYVWTVNDAALARTLVEMGADGIITDDPRLPVPARPC